MGEEPSVHSLKRLLEKLTVSGNTGVIPHWTTADNRLVPEKSVKSPIRCIDKAYILQQFRTLRAWIPNEFKCFRKVLNC